MARKFYSSRRYHSYFEGFTEKTVIENGRKKIVRLYTGEYYRPQGTARQRKVQKLLYCLLFLLTLGLYVFIATRKADINISNAIAICQGFALLDLLWLLVSLAEYICAKDKLTVRAYRVTSKRLRYLSLIAAGLFGIMSIFYLVSAILTSGAIPQLIVLLPPALLCTAAMTAMHLMERHTKYEKVPSIIAPVRDGEDINY